MGNINIYCTIINHFGFHDEHWRTERNQLNGQNITFLIIDECLEKQ